MTMGREKGGGGLLFPFVKKKNFNKRDKVIRGRPINDKGNNNMPKKGGGGSFTFILNIETQ